jgi:thiosulfate/3-mercaptopyruvate sulfurtransferase
VPDHRRAVRRRFSRRHAVQLGSIGTAGLALHGRPAASHPRSSPVASPGEGAEYAHPRMLIDAARVAQLRSERTVILVGFMPEEDSIQAHIPDSVQLDWPEFEVIDTSDASIAEWRDRTAQKLASLGITMDRPVVAYDAGTLFATRLWWVLHYLGHEESHVLNGGLAAWQRISGETRGSATPAGQPPLSPISFEPKPQAGILAQLDEVRASLDDPNVVIVDARTPDEYSAGHIPGAVNINYPRNATSEVPKLWKPAEELRTMYEQAGVTPDRHVIPYCSTGVRSAVTFFTLRLIGYENVALYTGSWKEWGEHPDTPKTTGSEP